MKETKEHTSRRHILCTLGIVGGVASLPSSWVKPVVNAVVLPAHAQTSTMCVADTSVGGPLAGHPSGATTCLQACEAEASDIGGQLCDFNEIPEVTGTICECEIDAP